jgi:DNA-binding CsgD family transcriptional regulator
LSNREVEVVLHIAGGLTKQEIADQMGVSPATADTFRRRAYVKLGVNSAAAAVAIVSAYLAGTRVEERMFEDAA